MNSLQGALLALILCAALVSLGSMTSAQASMAERTEAAARTEHQMTALRQMAASSQRAEERLDRLLAAVEQLRADASLRPKVAATATPAAAAVLPAPAATAATAATAAATAGAAADDGCPGRRPYHTVLTATGSVYQQWQARIMYHHWKKASAAGGKCTDMAAFTRLCATAGGRPDGLEGEIPTLFTVELSAQVLASHFHFGVLNRPNSVKQLMESTTLLAEIRKTSDYVLILETDHVIMRPIPNLATPVYGPVFSAREILFPARPL